MIVWFLVSVFLFCSIFLLVVYGGYSVFVFRNWNKDYNIAKRYDFFPTVSVVVPAYNEEETIAGKLQNLLEIDYPVDKMEIIVVDDGSTDKTAGIVGLFMGKGIKLLHQRERMGKIHALNLAFSRAQGEILITTDADVRTSKSIIKETIPYFWDKEIGTLCASQELENVTQSVATISESRFQNLQNLVRRAESAVDSTIVFNGEFTAVRRYLLNKIPPDAGVDDVEIPLMIRKKGYRCILIPEATFRDFVPPSFVVNWKQKARRAQGIVMALWRHRDVFFNSKYGKFGRIIFPYEFLISIICPYLLLGPMISGLLLIAIDVYVGAIIMGSLFLVMGSFLLVMNKNLKILSLSHSLSFQSIFSLLMAQFFFLFGSLRCLTKRQFHKWQKVEETRKSF